MWLLQILKYLVLYKNSLHIFESFVDRNMNHLLQKGKWEKDGYFFFSLLQFLNHKHILWSKWLIEKQLICLILTHISMNMHFQGVTPSILIYA